MTCLEVCPQAGVYRRFVSKLDRQECWIWLGGRNRQGYGFFYPHGPATRILAHRYSYEFFLGPIPEGLTIDHLCRVRACVRPSHLEAVTSEVNIRRSFLHDYGRDFTGCTHGNGAAKNCRQCHAEATRRYRARKRLLLKAQPMG